MNETVLVGHGDAVKTGCEVGRLNDFTNGEDAVVKELAVIGRPDYEVDRHHNAFLQFGNKHRIEGRGRKHGEWC